MRRFIVPVIALCLASTPSTLLSQPAQRGILGCGFGGESAAGILEQRAELGLSAEQVGQLEQVRARQQQRNAPLVAQLEAAGVERGAGAGAGVGRADGRAARGRGRGLTAEERARIDAARPVIQEIRENNREACESAQALLSEAQLARLAERQSQRTSAPGGRGFGPRRGVGGNW